MHPRGRTPIVLLRESLNREFHPGLSNSYARNVRSMDPPTSGQISKRAIETQSGITKMDQQLIHEGRLLHNTPLLFEYDISPWVRKCRGCTLDQASQAAAGGALAVLLRDAFPCKVFRRAPHHALGRQRRAQHGGAPVACATSQCSWQRKR